MWKPPLRARVAALRSGRRSQRVAADWHIRLGTRFEPDLAVVPGDAPARLTFRRASAGGARDAIIFPALGRLVTLPAGRDVSVELGPLPAGRYLFSCGSGTPSGTLVVVGGA